MNLTIEEIIAALFDAFQGAGPMTSRDWRVAENLRNILSARLQVCVGVPDSNPLLSREGQ